MRSSQLQAYLAQRRAIAHDKRPMRENEHHYQSEANPNNKEEQGPYNFIFY